MALGGRQDYLAWRVFVSLPALTRASHPAAVIEPLSPSENSRGDLGAVFCLHAQESPRTRLRVGVALGRDLHPAAGLTCNLVPVHPGLSPRSGFLSDLASQDTDLARLPCCLFFVAVIKNTERTLTALDRTGLEPAQLLCPVLYSGLPARLPYLLLYQSSGTQCTATSLPLTVRSLQSRLISPWVSLGRRPLG